jgi:hypothetical protein
MLFFSTTTHRTLATIADRLDRPEIAEVRIILVPAAELVLGLTDTGVALVPPRLGLTVIHRIGNGPDHCDLTCERFATASPRVYAQGYRELFQFRSYVSPGVKKPALGRSGEYLSYLFT